MQTSTWFAKHTLTDPVEGHWQDNELGSEKIGWNGQNFKYPLYSVYLLRCFPRSLFCKLCNVFGTMLTCQIVSFHTTEAILADSVCFQSANGQTDYSGTTSYLNWSKFWNLNCLPNRLFENKTKCLFKWKQIHDFTVENTQQLICKLKIYLSSNFKQKKIKINIWTISYYIRLSLLALCRLCLGLTAS